MKDLRYLSSKHTNKSLKRLFLDNTEITSESFVSITNIIKNLSTLEILSLSNNNLSQASFNLLRKLSKSRLNSINLSNCWIQADSLDLLLDSLLVLPNVKSLNLSENHFEPSMMPRIAHFMKHKTFLVNLDLSKNPLKDEGVSLLSVGVKYNKSLKQISLADTQFVFQGAFDLADALNNNYSLCKLNLANNQIKDEAKKEIQDKIDRNKNMKNQIEIPKIKKEAVKLKKKI